MSSQKAPEDTATEGQETARPNAFAARIQRVVAGAQAAWQRLRARFGKAAEVATAEGDAEAGERPGRGRAKGAPAAAADGAHAEAAPAERPPPTRVRTAIVGALALVVGILLGMFASYDMFADRLGSQAEQIAAQRETLIELEKEGERAKRAETESRDNLAETQKALVEAQRNVARLSSFARKRVNETDSSEAESPPRSVASRAATGGKIAPAAPARPQSGTCDIGANNPAEGLARCLSEFNR